MNRHVGSHIRVFRDKIKDHLTSKVRRSFLLIGVLKSRSWVVLSKYLIGGHENIDDENEWGKGQNDHSYYNLTDPNH